jgi:hypothetical protein
MNQDQELEIQLLINTTPVITGKKVDPIAKDAQ